MSNRRNIIARRYAQSAWGGPGTMPMAGYSQSRAADTVALGGIFASSTRQLPQAGGPEVLQRGGPYGMNGCGCGCKGAPGGCGDAGDGIGSVPVLDTISNTIRPIFGDKSSYATVGILAIGAYWLYKKMK